jgi:type IV pilus assembly protein PilF
MEKPPAENPVLADLVDYRTGLSLLREGRVDEAISVLARARQSSPRDPNVSNGLGLALLYKKDYPGAEKAFTEALRLKSDFLDARNNRGVTYLEMNRLDDAERDFQAVLDGPPSPDRANAYFNLGLVYRKKAQWVDAEREFSLAVADSPEMLRARRERGLVRVQLENFRDALEDFLAVLKLDPKDVTANYNAALCLLAVGRRDLALRYMERAASAGPESDDGRKARRFLDAEQRRPGNTT